MVTSRTAELLGIQDRVGSLEPGKDADFVIWNGDPFQRDHLKNLGGRTAVL